MSEKINANVFEKSRKKIVVLKENICKIIKGKDESIDLILASMLAGGHILLDDYPGCGKTTLVKALSASIKKEKKSIPVFKRIQMTPDLLPLDIIGSSILTPKNKKFSFIKGPVFTNILLVDEINRTSPKVQSALLECMEEKTITTEGETYFLEDFFFVVATMNPLDTQGTYPLPIAQLDRFYMKIPFSYTEEKEELNILSTYLDIFEEKEKIKSVITVDEIIEIQNMIKDIKITNTLIQAVLMLLRKTRESRFFLCGGSTRCGIIFLQTAKAYAFLKGKDYVSEDDIMALSNPVLCHRIISKENNAEEELQTIIDDVISHITKVKFKEKKEMK